MFIAYVSLYKIISRFLVILIINTMQISLLYMSDIEKENNNKNNNKI